MASLAIILSFAQLFLFNSEEKQTLIFRHSFTSMEVRHTTLSSSHPVIFPRNVIASASIGDVKILSIDNAIDPDSLSSLIKDKDIKSYLFVGPSASSQQISLIAMQRDFKKIILHSGIGKNKKAEILDLLPKSLHQKVYSLRESGSFETDL